MKTTASRFRKNWFLQGLITILMMPGLVIFPVALQANPSGATVVAGSISFDGLNTSSLTINQSTQNGIINWNDFSIGAGELTQFVQPNASALTINRVTGGNPSAIYGQLRANGNIMVINTNGILVGASGVIDVKGAVTLSTLDAANHDLLNGGSTLFSGAGTAGVTNYGLISGRDVIFMGNTINNYGQVTAARAIAMGAGGEILLGQTQDGATISVRGGGAGADTGINNSGTIAGGNVFLEGHGNTYNRAINNSGTVRATGFNYRGGRLTLSGGSGSRIVNTGNMYARQQNGAGGQIRVTADTVELASGRVDASGDHTDGGSVEVTAADITVGSDALILADGIEGGSINLDASGELNMAGTASSTGRADNGGTIDITGEQVNVAATAVMDVTGFSAGGAIRAGGGFQGNDADIMNATTTTVEEGALLIADGEYGDGGIVIVWADEDTMFSGDISAQALGATGNGGFVEVSGKRNLRFDGMVSTLANNGQNGTLLLDPSDILIANAGNANADITVETLVGTAHGTNGWDPALVTGGLISGGNVVIATDANVVGSGNITIGAAAGNVDDIHYRSDNSLTFLAHGNISVNSNVLNHQDNTGASTGHLNFIAGWDGTLPSPIDANLDFDAISTMNYGAAGAIVQINSAGRQEVSVASRAGETNVLSDIVLVTATGSREFAQIGYRNYLLSDALAYHSSGAINVRAESFVGVLTDFVTNGIGDGYAKIGHGGSTHRVVMLLNDNGSVAIPDYRNIDATLNTVSQGQVDNDTIHKGSGIGTMAGDISVISGGAVRVTGSDDRSFAQIGHGGLGEGFDNPYVSGNLLYQPASALNSIQPNPAAGGDNNGDGDPDFVVVGTATLNEAIAADAFGTDRNDIDLANVSGVTLNNANRRYTLIRVSDGTNSEIIGIKNVDNTSRIDLERRGFYDPNNTTYAFGVGATVEFLDLDVDFQGTPSTTPQGLPALGYLEGTKTGNITVEGSSIEVLAGQRINSDSTGNAFAMIGHGGTNAPGAASGDISVVSRTSITAYGSDLSDNAWNNFAQIGHGGINSGAYRSSLNAVSIGADPDGQLRATVNGNANAAGLDGLGHSGAVFVEAQGGDIILMAGIHSNNYVQVGHGGTNAHGNHDGTMVSDGSQTSGAIKDGITVSATGNVILDRLDDHQDRRARAGSAYTQIGMGGRYAGGRMHSDIDVDAGGNLEMHAGSAGGAYSQIGNGGSTDTNSARRADGALTGNVDVDVAGDLLMRAGSLGEDSHVQIGHGGRSRIANYFEGHNGEITLDVGGDVTMEAGSLNRVTTQEGYDMMSTRNYALIGHGGYETYGNHYGNITLNSGGNLVMETYIGFREYNPGADRYSGDARGEWSYAQIGHGGARNDATTTGWDIGLGVLGESNIEVNVAGNIDMRSAFEAGQARADIIVDQTETTLDFNGDGNVDAADETVMAPVQFARDNYTQIGHGGSARNSNNDTDRRIEGDITIRSGGDISMTGGHLNHASNGQAEDISDLTTHTISTHENDVVPVDNYTRIGHAGMQYNTSTDGDITVIADGNVTLQAGNGRRESAVIGSGGYNGGFGTNGQEATREGDIIVYAGGDVSLTGSNGEVSRYRGSEYSYAQIGNDMVLDSATDTSNITVVAMRDVLVTAGTNDMDAYAQIGSGGIDRARVNIDGFIDVTAGRNVIITGDESDSSVYLTPNGTTYASIGHGSRVNNSRTDKPFNNGTNTGDPNPIVGDRNQNQNNTQWNGNVYVKAGNNIELEDGFIGHIDEGSGTETNITSFSGNTYIAASRSEAYHQAGGDGAIIADANSGFSSAGQGVYGDLRLYMPNRPENQIDVGATLNAIAYTGTPAGVAELGVSQRSDELLDFPEFEYTDMNVAWTGGNVEINNGGSTTNSGSLVDIDFNVSTGDFTPEGGYSLVNGLGGFYQVYYNNIPPAVEPGPPLIDVDLVVFVDDMSYEAYDWAYGLFEWDGYEPTGLWDNLGAGDAIDDGSVPRSGLEQVLDGALGSRTGGSSGPSGGESGDEGTSNGFGSDSERERIEEQERIQNFRMRQVGKGQNQYYIYSPATGTYSSLRMFGVPISDIPAFSQ